MCLLQHCPSLLVRAPETYLAHVIGFMGFQSSGTVSLQSNIAQDKPLIDPKFLSHPFDRRLVIECMREAFKFLDQASLSKDRLRLVNEPKGLSDEEILVSPLIPIF